MIELLAGSPRRLPPLALIALFVSLCLLAAWSADARAEATQPETVVEQALQASTVTPAVGQPVTFSIATNAGSGPINGNVTWTFDDGTSATTSSSGAVHSFNSPGLYNVTVTGTTATGQSVSATTTVRVVGSAPATSTTPSVAPGTSSPLSTGVVSPISVSLPQSNLPPSSVAIVSPPVNAAVDQPLTFTAASAVSSNSCGGIAGYLWDFGDTTREVLGQTVGHTYTAPGTYNVNLTVTDCSGATATASTQVHVTAAQPGVAVSFAAGWNLVAGAAGSALAGAVGSLYTLQAGDSTYETLSPTSALNAGEGYWAFFPGASSGSIPPGSTGAVSVPLAAGGYVMIGNSGTTPATVSGADAVLIYDPIGGYQPATVLEPGQGAWAFSASGGTATITPAP
jgi:PKD repeat protein